MELDSGLLSCFTWLVLKYRKIDCIYSLTFDFSFFSNHFLLVL